MKKYLISTLFITSVAGYTAFATWKHFHHPLSKAKNFTISDSNITADGSLFSLKIPSNTPKGIIVYLEDKGAVNQGKDFFIQLAELSYSTVKIDWAKLSPLSCEGQKKLIKNVTNQVYLKTNIKQEQLPILVTDHQASSIVVELMQSERYHAAVSMHASYSQDSNSNHCSSPSTTASEKPIDLHANWYIFNDSNIPQERNLGDTLNSIPNAKFTLTENTPNSSTKEAIQILQWLDPRLQDQLTSAANNQSIPIIEVQSSATPSKDHSELMAVFLTGDGGWAAIDKNIAKAFSEKGIPTLGFDSLSYFWKARTPEETAADLEKIATIYAHKWNKKKIILIGYSFGADVMPFLINRFSVEFQQNISLVTLLSMGATASFEFKLTSWLNADKRPERPATLPELKKASGLNVICIYGTKDPDSVCNKSTEYGALPIDLPGDHHFNDDYALVMEKIFSSLENKKTPN